MNSFSLKQFYLEKQARPSIVNSTFAPGAVIGRTLQNISVVFDSGPLAPLCENTTSSRKPEVHNILQCRHWGTTTVICRENMATFGMWCLRYACGQTDKQQQSRWSKYYAHLRGWSAENTKTNSGCFLNAHYARRSPNHSRLRRRWQMPRIAPSFEHPCLDASSSSSSESSRHLH